MAKVCSICGKGKMKGNSLSETRSHVSRRTIKHYKPNIQKTTIEIDGQAKSVNVCTKCKKGSKKDK